MQHRTDFMQLPSPEYRPDGTRIYTAKLVGADDQLRYAHGVETVSLALIQNEEFHRSLVGTPIIMQSSGRHDPDSLVDVSSEDIAVGTVIEAWNEERDLFIRFTVQKPSALKELHSRGVWELSHGYTPELDGTLQVWRITNHVSIVERGNASGTQFRADSLTGVPMQDELVEIAPEDLEEVVEEVVEETERIVEDVEHSLDALKQRVAELEALLAAAQLDVFEQARYISELQVRADSLSIAEPEDGWESVASLEEAIALALGADTAKLGRADSAFYCKTWIEASDKIGRAITDFNQGVSPRMHPHNPSWDY